MVRWTGLAVCFVLAAGCNGDKCPADKQIDAWVDADGDGFGGEQASGICEIEEGYAEVGGDCDDNNETIAPGREEQCNGLDDDCDDVLDNGQQLQAFYADADTDGWGDEANSIQACAPPTAEWSTTPGDCMDDNNQVNPDVREICNGGIDDDCDGLIDDDDDSIDESTYTEWFADSDGDGYGRSAGVSVRQCLAPPGGVADGSDCDDGEASINPAAQEICNMIDDDCDDLRDDFDDSLDTSGQTEWNADADGDTFGDPDVMVMACGPIPGIAANDGEDCDDTTDLVAPNLNETLCDSLNNDCDDTTPDDADVDEDGYFACADNDCRDQNPNIHPDAVEVGADGVDQNCDGFEDCYVDNDGDGSRTDVPVQVTDPECDDAPNAPPDFPIDCDDNDVAITWSGRWELDSDLDGYGDGVTALTDCTEQGAGYVLQEAGDTDCNDSDDTIHPAAFDSCNDGLDADCDTIDTCPSCKDWIDSDPALTSGIYLIRPTGEAEIEIYCDMETDGGGWTMVGASAFGTLNDQGGGYYEDLTTLEPVDSHPGVWNGLSTIVNGANTDMRFTCKTLVTDLAYTVDLSFYDVPWYSEFVSGSDASVCFTEDANPLPTPARRNNLTNDSLTSDDPYEGGALVGEDACTDSMDFTVDFTDNGMDGDADDGTDWGEDDGKEKCGVANAGEAWFIFVREL
jgi:hypothetical protein